MRQIQRHFSFKWKKLLLLRLSDSWKCTIIMEFRTSTLRVISCYINHTLRRFLMLRYCWSHTGLFKTLLVRKLLTYWQCAEEIFQIKRYTKHKMLFLQVQSYFHDHSFSLGNYCTAPILTKTKSRYCRFLGFLLLGRSWQCLPLFVRHRPWKKTSEDCAMSFCQVSGPLA